MKTSKIKPKNLATPGKPMTQEAFLSLIKEAENGEFTPIEESIKRMNEWIAQRKK